MIKLTKLDGNKVVINTDLIQTVKATPDTVVTLSNQKNIIVRETVDEIISKVISYKKKILPDSQN